MKLNTVFPIIFFFISFVFSKSDPLAANAAVDSVFSSIEQAASKLLENNPRAELITLVALGLLDAETEQKLQEVEGSVPEDIKKLGSNKALEKLSSSLGGLKSALGQSKKRAEHVARASFSANGHIQKRNENAGGDDTTTNALGDLLGDLLDDLLHALDMVLSSLPVVGAE